MEQLSLLDLTGPLLPGRLKSPEEFESELTPYLPEPAAIVFTRNRSTIISVKKDRTGKLTVRLQEVFLAADSETIRALGQFLRRPTPRSRQVLNTFLRENQELLEALAREPRCHRWGTSQGMHRDLQLILNKIRREYSLQLPRVTIIWGRPAPRRRRSSIKFGSWCRKCRTITIHPDLDDPAVPEFFVEFIVYHELLHALFPAPPPGGRRGLHGPQFRLWERRFRQYPAACEYERWFVQSRLGPGPVKEGKGGERPRGRESG